MTVYSPCLLTRMIPSVSTSSTELADGADSPEAVSFRDAHWKIRWIVFSLAILLLLRAIMFLRTEWRLPLPWWLILITSVIAPQLFMLFLPIVTRVPRAPLQLPTLKRCWVEMLIALPVVIAVASTIVVVEYVVSHVAPGKSILPERILHMAESSNHLAVYSFMLTSFKLVPFSEEVFFRGFLQNAFRTRMPWLLATIVQCVIFGFGHTFGIVHAGGAFVTGMILTILYDWRQTLITPIFVHAGSNFLCSVALAWAMWTFPGIPTLGVGGDTGPRCFVQEVVPGSAAANAGIQRGDVIITFSTERIRDFPDLVETVRRYQPGDRITISIERAGSSMDVELVLGRRGE